MRFAHTVWCASGALLCGVSMLMPATAATVPAAQSFESFAEGYSITNEVDWGGEAPAGIVSTNQLAVHALVSYTNSGGVYPLPAATHEKVLAVSDTVTHTVSGGTGGVVRAEWLVMPTQRDNSPLGLDENQLAFYFSTNDELVVWHRDPSIPTNQWLTLSGNPTIGTSDWVRVTVLQDYATDRYQVSIDGTAYTNALGEDRGGVSPGSWFHMVQTNGYVSSFEAHATVETFIDDVVFTNRSVSYSGALFAEAVGNDGSIVTTQTITLAGGAFADPLTSSHFTAASVPSGLTATLSRVDDTTATLSFAGNANAPHADDVVVAFELLDGAFALGSAASVVGYTNSLTLDFHDGTGLVWSTNALHEASANDGSVAGAIAVTVAGDSFKNTTYTEGVEYEVASGTVPAGLSLAVAYQDPQQVTVSLTGTASSHDGGSGSFTLAFRDAAFVGGSAAAVPDSSSSLSVNFAAQPSLGYSSTTFVERAANDGGFDQTVTITLTGDTWAADIDAATHVSLSGAPPAGLSLVLARTTDTTLTASLSGTATDHDGTPDGGFTLSFSNSAFVAVGDASLVHNTSQAFVVDFNAQPSLSYSTTTFSESLANDGTVDTVMTITLSPNGSGETFAGSNGQDFKALGWMSTADVPSGLTAVAERTSDTTLSVTLDGVASPHDVDTGAMDFVFTGGAFTRADLAQVENAGISNLVVDFISGALGVNLVPYSESFESYADGSLLGASQGWQPDGAGRVTTEASIVSELTSSFSEFPIETTHAKVLKLTEACTDEVRSAAGGRLYTDFMLYVTPRTDAPSGSLDYQVAFYVNTNQQLVIWHDGPTVPEWATLTGTHVTTGAWHRFTVHQDHANHRFQIFLDGSETPISDAAGYARWTGSTHPGTWFKMVSQSNRVSQIELFGIDDTSPSYLDDLVVDTARPGFIPEPGSLFMFR